MIAIALFIVMLGVVVAALGTGIWLVQWFDERSQRTRYNRMRNLNRSWQSSPTHPNQST